MKEAGNKTVSEVGKDDVIAVILAAGQGKRMKSELPKVMHRVCGKPMAGMVYEAIRGSGVERCVMVVGFGAEKVQEYFADSVGYAVQEKQLGTGHAVKTAMESIGDFNGRVLVMNGDLPLVRAQTIRALINQGVENQDAATMVTAELENPTGFGRIIRNSTGEFCKIVEQKEASKEELEIKEVNTGVYCFDAASLLPALNSLNNNNAQQEFYLTDVLESIIKSGKRVGIYKLEDSRESVGVNDRSELAALCETVQFEICQKLMRDEGVTILAPHNTYIDSDVVIGQDTVVYPGCVLEGTVKIGTGCTIGPNSRIVNSTIGNHTTVESSVVVDSAVANGVSVGPFAYLRPHSNILDKVKIGDFVEIKNATIGAGTKIPHLSYVGDADVGGNTNIGCGVITCNYDGKKKYRTQVGDNVFVGSNSNLVAPVKVGNDVYVASGSTVTEDVPEGALVIARARQTVKESWVEKKGLLRGK